VPVSLTSDRQYDSEKWEAACQGKVPSDMFEQKNYHKPAKRKIVVMTLTIKNEHKSFLEEMKMK
jgi:hypothetical protein